MLSTSGHDGFKGQVWEFSSLANGCLERVAKSFGVRVRPGHYQEVFAAARRTSRKGHLRDDEGDLEYRFHGAGCEFHTSDFALDFNAFPMVDGISPIAFDAFKFAKFMNSRGISSDEATVCAKLLTLVEDGLISRADGRDYFYTFVREEESAGTHPTTSTRS